MTIEKAILKLQQFAQHKGYCVRYKVLLNKLPGTNQALWGCAYPSGLIEIQKNLSDYDHLDTLAHEIAHQMLHCHDDVPLSKEVKEYEAELIAANVMLWMCNIIEPKRNTTIGSQRLRNVVSEIFAYCGV